MTDVEKWKIKHLMKFLNNAKGNGTSMITLIIPAGSQISMPTKMLVDEYGTAQNIKSRVNKLSVLSAITSAQQRLKLYRFIPKNGLCIFCGTCMIEEKEKKYTLDFEPFKPINKSLYMCDNRFHTEPLMELLDDDTKYGFIVMDGHKTLYGVVTGNHRTTLQTISVDLPQKHNKGGQSANRYARLCQESRHNYVTKAAEFATHHFISNNKPNVSGLILAGSADFKDKLYKSDLFDPRLKKVVLKLVDVCYSGENGFNQAIELSKECLQNVKYIIEKNLLEKFYTHIAKDTGLVCYGIRDVEYALESGAVDTLILWEDLPLTRYEYIIKGDGDSDTTERHGYGENEIDGDITDKKLYTEWISENYARYGCQLEFISDNSTEGSQFCKGFGGIGAILRFPVEFEHLDNDENEEIEDDEDDLEEYFM